MKQNKIEILLRKWIPEAKGHDSDCPCDQCTIIPKLYEAILKCLPEKQQINEVHSFFKLKLNEGEPVSAYDYAGGQVNGFNQALSEIRKSIDILFGKE